MKLNNHRLALEISKHFDQMDIDNEQTSENYYAEFEIDGEIFSCDYEVVYYIYNQSGDGIDIEKEADITYSLYNVSNVYGGSDSIIEIDFDKVQSYFNIAAN